MSRDGKRWHKGAGEYGDYVEAPKVDAFLAEIAEVCRRHGFDIEHEDSQGAFVIDPLPAGAEPSGIMHAQLGRSVPLE